MNQHRVHREEESVNTGGRDEASSLSKQRAMFIVHLHRVIHTGIDAALVYSERFIKSRSADRGLDAEMALIF